MARSREALWLAHVGGLGGAGGVLLGISAALGTATKGYSVWTSAPAIVAYVMFGLAVACFACAFYDVPIRLPRRVRSAEPVLTTVHPQVARVGDRVTVYGNFPTVSTAGSLKAAVAGVDAEVLAPPATARGPAFVREGGQVTFLVPPLPASVARAPGGRHQVSVTTPAGLVAALNNALDLVPDKPVAVRLSPALIVVASAAEYADIPIEIAGQYLATPGATTADTATAQVSIHGPNTAATTTAAYVDDHHVSFTLPPGIPVPAGVPLALQVQLVRGASSAQPLPLTVQAAPAPELDAINPNLIVADPGTSLAGQLVSLVGANLLPPTSTVGAPRNVAGKSAETLRAAVTDAAGVSVGHLADQPRLATTAAVTLLDPLVIPQAGDALVTIVLERGSLSCEPRTLTLRARYDPAMTVTPITAWVGTEFAGHEVTMSSPVFSVNLPASQHGLHIAAFNSGLLARVDAGGVVLDVPNLPSVPDGQTDLTFMLPPDTPVMPQAPPGGARWNIQVSRNGHVIATGDLVLHSL